MSIISLRKVVLKTWRIMIVSSIWSAALSNYRVRLPVQTHQHWQMLRYINRYCSFQWIFQLQSQSARGRETPLIAIVPISQCYGFSLYDIFQFGELHNMPPPGDPHSHGSWDNSQKSYILRNRIIPNEATSGAQEPRGRRPSGSWVLMAALLGIMRFLKGYGFLLYGSFNKAYADNYNGGSFNEISV